MLNTHRSVDDHLVIPPFGDPNQALFNGTRLQVASPAGFFENASPAVTHHRDRNAEAQTSTNARPA
jgi:hypothetical protein